MSYRTPANLSLLPPELIRHICGYLSTSDILSLELTDRQQRRLIGESGVWRDVVLRWREKMNKKCPQLMNMEQMKMVDQMVNFFVSKGLQEARYFKVVEGIISQTIKVLTVIDSKEERCKISQAWMTYLSIVRPMVGQFITEEKKLTLGVGRKEISELWFALNIPTAHLRNRLSWFTLYENRFHV